MLDILWTGFAFCFSWFFFQIQFGLGPLYWVWNWSEHILSISLWLFWKLISHWCLFSSVSLVADHILVSFSLLNCVQQILPLIFFPFSAWYLLRTGACLSWSNIPSALRSLSILLAFTLFHLWWKHSFEIAFSSSVMLLYQLLVELNLLLSTLLLLALLPLCLCWNFGLKIYPLSCVFCSALGWTGLLHFGTVMNYWAGLLGNMMLSWFPPSTSFCEPTMEIVDDLQWRLQPMKELFSSEALIA